LGILHAFGAYLGSRRSNNSSNTMELMAIDPVCYLHSYWRSLFCCVYTVSIPPQKADIAISNGTVNGKVVPCI